MGNRSLQLPINSTASSDVKLNVGIIQRLKCNDIISQYNDQVQSNVPPPYVILSNRKLVEDEKHCLEQLFEGTGLIMDQIEEDSNEYFMGLHTPKYYKIVFSQESVDVNNESNEHSKHDSKFSSKRRRIYDI